MHFVVVPSSRQRRLVPVPAAVWRSGFLAGYDPALDATAVSMGPADGKPHHFPTFSDFLKNVPCGMNFRPHLQRLAC